MGFYTLPIIDLNSERSDDSVIKTRSIFMRKYGFISREVDGSQDCGVDIYTEITDNGNSTGAIFPIQIKSGKKGHIIKKEGKEYISLKFVSGRFGYLCRQAPFHGIIVFYDEASGTLYYDYVQELFLRLTADKKDDSWQQQHYIMLHFPITNILNEISVEQIRLRFLTVQQNHSVLMQEKGPEYGLQPISSGVKRILSKNDIVRKLEKEGILLFNNLQCAEITGLIEELSGKDIYANPKLLFWAIVSYAEIGYLLDAALYHAKYFALTKRLPVEFEETLRIYGFVIDHGLGRYNREEALGNLLEIRGEISTPDNLSALDTHISMLQLELTIGDKIFDICNVEEVFKVITLIEERATSEPQRIIQKVIQSEVLIHAVSRLYADYLTDSHLYPAIPEPSVHIERGKYIQEKYDLILSINHEAIEYSKTIHNIKMEAISKHNIAKCHYSFYSSQYVNSINPTNKDEIQEILEEGIILGLDSWKLYQQLPMFRDAYLSIRTVYELYRLGEEFLNKKLDSLINLGRIKEILNSYSQYDFYNKYQSTIDVYCTNINEDTKHPFFNIADGNIDDFAKRFLHSLGLPFDRLNNIKDDIRNYQNYKKYCDDFNLVLLSNQASADAKDFWKNPVHYILLNNDTGNIEIEGMDVITMLKQIGHFRNA